MNGVVCLLSPGIAGILKYFKFIFDSILKFFVVYVIHLIPNKSLV